MEYERRYPAGDDVVGNYYVVSPQLAELDGSLVGFGYTDDFEVFPVGSQQAGGHDYRDVFRLVGVGGYETPSLFYICQIEGRFFKGFPDNEVSDVLQFEFLLYILVVPFEENDNFVSPVL